MMNQTKEGEVIVCLGQALLSGAKASTILLTRCDKAVDLHHERDCLIISTGGDPAGVGVTEARAMAEYMTNVKGIEKDAIVEEGDAKSTLENALFVLRILEKMNRTIDGDRFGGVSKLHLVTSPHHMVRSSYIFNAVFAYHNCNIKVVEEPSIDMLNQTEFKQRLMKEKSGVEWAINKTLQLTSPVFGSRSGHNIPFPDKEVLHAALRKINTMLEDVEAS